MFKKALSILLALTLIVMPFSGSIVFTATAASTSLPLISINIEPYAAISPDTSVTVTFAAQGGNTLASCDTRLEGTSLGTDSTVSFTPAAQGLSDGLYTIVAEATDSEGLSSIEPLTFLVSSDLEVDYTVENGTVSSASAVTVYEADALDYTALYGTADDGIVDPTAAHSYSAQEIYDLRYTDTAVSVSSVSGIPYQLFDIDLAGKTSGEVAISYSGSTKEGERMAVKVFNPAANEWDTVGTFTGTGSVSELVDIATYYTDGKLHVAAVLDYVTNGASSMIWSTDPQHYTKFRDLNEYYYKIYQFAADQYEAGEVGYIINTGDLVDDIPTASIAPSQWEVASKAMSIVEAVGMPNGLVSGNHDVNTFTSADYSIDNPVNYTLFAQTFPADRYNNERWYGGSLNNNTSHYDLVTIGNVDFIILYLGYGLEATDETIAWANDVLETYSHRTAIIATHEYLDSATAVRADTGRGELIYQNIVDPNPNVKMVICGHDDGSLMLERTASDGRTYYEILSDYQFVEAEDPSFYANEHYIGSVPHCCGDGYIRIMTVEGDSLTSITYSPVTDRYNPYGDRESFTIDLNTGAADREFLTTRFSAAVLGNETTATDTDRMAVVSDGSNTTYTHVMYASVPTAPEASTTAIAATPEQPFFAHAATTAPTVDAKFDVLAAAGFSTSPTITASSSYALSDTVDLNKTPYLYYSFTLPEGSLFSFAFQNDLSTYPWLSFFDASGETPIMNYGSSTFDSLGTSKYATVSMTGCIDMRKLLSYPTSTAVTLQQVRFYNPSATNAVMNYLFFGSAAITSPDGEIPNDLSSLQALITKAGTFNTSLYESADVTELNAALSQANAALSGDHLAVTSAYERLANAIGTMTLIKETIDESTLTSIKNYTLNLSNFSVASHLNTTQTNDGFYLEIPSTATSAWGAASSYDSYTVKAERGQLYLKLDVDANSNWALQMGVTQNGVSGTVHMNGGIENAFSSAGVDGAEGVFQGIYDVSDAFEMNGFDPASTFTVSYLHFYVVGIGGSVTFNHVELLTNASDGVTDGGALQAAINRAGTYTQSLYTSASWSSMQTVLSSAKSALSDSSLAEADLNLHAYILNNALDNLVYAGSYPETDGSLLPADPAQWTPSASGEITATRENGITVIQNTTGYWPSVTYTLNDPLRVFIKESRLVADLDVGAAASILLNIGGDEWIKVNPYIGAVNSDVDLTAGTCNVSIPLSEIPEIADLTSITVYKVRVFSVGAAASSAVTLRTLRIADYDSYEWDGGLTDYGVAATPSNPYYAHCAPYAPEVANKVDLLTSLGMDAHATVSGWSGNPVSLTIDLNKTPYLYYSLAVPTGGNFTFGFFNNTNYSPYFVFRDATGTGAFMNQSVPTWDTYTAGEQYITGSETGCIDMRTLVNDSSITTWVLTNITFYNTSGEDVVISYLFFGSEPLYVEENIDIEDDSLMGDVNGDGSVTTVDVREILHEILRVDPTFTDRQKRLADVNGDGSVSSSDIRQILQSIVS